MSQSKRREGGVFLPVERRTSYDCETDHISEVRVGKGKITLCLRPRHGSEFTSSH